jgi:hypothetical protein
MFQELELEQMRQTSLHAFLSESKKVRGVPHILILRTPLLIDFQAQRS